MINEASEISPQGLWEKLSDVASRLITAEIGASLEREEQIIADLARRYEKDHVPDAAKTAARHVAILSQYMKDHPNVMGMDTDGWAQNVQSRRHNGERGHNYD